MPSSPTLPVAVEPLAQPSLHALLAGVDDPRKRRGIRHGLQAVLAVSIAAVLAGARSFAAISEWVADADTGALTALGAGRPSEPTIRRVLTLLDADLLDRVIGAWTMTRTGVIAGRRVIAVDGKTVRGARTAGQTVVGVGVGAVGVHGGDECGRVGVLDGRGPVPGAAAEGG